MTNVVDFPGRAAAEADDWDEEEARHWAARVDHVRDGVGRDKWASMTMAEKHDAFKALPPPPLTTP